MSGGFFEVSPGEILGPGKNVVVGFETATALLRALFRSGSARAPTAGFAFVADFDDTLRTAIGRSQPAHPELVDAVDDAARESYWARWLDGARDASLAVSEAYWSRLRNGGDALDDEDLARIAASLVESLKWNACDRFGPDETLWTRLSALLAEVPELDDDEVIRQRSPAIAVEYLRAVAYHSAQFDQLALPEAVAAAHLIDLSMPWLTLEREPDDGAQYVVSPNLAPVPQWQVAPDGRAQWHFMPWQAERLLAEISLWVEGHTMPRMLNRAKRETYRAALAHLRKLWSSTPPARQEVRRPLPGTFAVACGVEECKRLAHGGALDWKRQWAAVDVSRKGIALLAPSTPGLSWPELGELLGFMLAEDGTFHVGIVRRFRIVENWNARYGIQIMSRSARAVEVFDGKHFHPVLLCDEIVSGKLLRLVSLPAALQRDRPLRLALAGQVTELEPVSGLQQGKGFDIRAYRAA